MTILRNLLNKVVFSFGDNQLVVEYLSREKKTSQLNGNLWDENVNIIRFACLVRNALSEAIALHGV